MFWFESDLAPNLLWKLDFIGDIMNIKGWFNLEQFSWDEQNWDGHENYIYIKKRVVRGITDGGVLFFILYIYLGLLLDNIC